MLFARRLLLVSFVTVLSSLSFTTHAESKPLDDAFKDLKSIYPSTKIAAIETIKLQAKTTSENARAIKNLLHFLRYHALTTEEADLANRIIAQLIKTEPQHLQILLISYHKRQRFEPHIVTEKGAGALKILIDANPALLTKIAEHKSSHIRGYAFQYLSDRAFARHSKRSPVNIKDITDAHAIYLGLLEKQTALPPQVLVEIAAEFHNFMIMVNKHARRDLQEKIALEVITNLGSLFRSAVSNSVTKIEWLLSGVSNHLSAIKYLEYSAEHGHSLVMETHQIMADIWIYVQGHDLEEIPIELIWGDLLVLTEDSPPLAIAKIDMQRFTERPDYLRRRIAAQSLARIKRAEMEALLEKAKELVPSHSIRFLRESIEKAKNCDGIFGSH